MTTPDADCLAEIEVRWSKATHGPWYLSDETEQGFAILKSRISSMTMVFVRHGERSKDDAEAIASAPADVAYLLALVRHLHASRGADAKRVAFALGDRVTVALSVRKWGGMVGTITAGRTQARRKFYGVQLDNRTDSLDFWGDELRCAYRAGQEE
jgi:hypothetical protein